MLDEDGGVIDDLIVYHSGDIEYLVIANAANRDVDIAWIREHAPADIEIVDESDRTGLIAVQGPKALGVLAELAGEGWTPPARFHLAEVDARRSGSRAGRPHRLHRRRRCRDRLSRV